MDVSRVSLALVTRTTQTWHVGSMQAECRQKTIMLLVGKGAEQDFSETVAHSSGQINDEEVKGC